MHVQRGEMRREAREEVRRGQRVRQEESGARVSQGKTEPEIQTVYQEKVPYIFEMKRCKSVKRCGKRECVHRIQNVQRKGMRMWKSEVCLEAERGEGERYRQN